VNPTKKTLPMKPGVTAPPSHRRVAFGVELWFHPFIRCRLYTG
jgi:hypothetical protein